MKEYYKLSNANHSQWLNRFRKDHYNGKNALFRLSAVIYKEKIIDKLNEEDLLKLFLEELEMISVIPNEIIIFSDKIEIHWYTKGYQMIMNRNQYLGLISQFLLFVRDIPIEGIQFLERCLLEDPDRTVWGIPNELINFSPCFNSACFGLAVGQTIKVLKINETLGVAM